MLQSIQYTLEKWPRYSFDWCETYSFSLWLSVLSFEIFQGVILYLRHRTIQLRKKAVKERE